MRIKRAKRSGLLETAVSSDLPFLLIVYFLVIAGFNINQGFLVNLPESDSNLVVPKNALLRFEMDGSGRIFYEGKELGIDEAQREIRYAIEGQSDPAVVLSIDGQAPWQQVVYFVELAQKLNVQVFSFNKRENS